MNPPPAPPPQSTPYGPLQRRLLGLAGLLSVLMIALIVFHALHTDSTGFNAVAEAADETAKMPGGHIAVEVKYSIPGGAAPLVGSGDGVFDTRTGRTDLSLSMPIPGRPPMFFEAISTPRKVFLRGSALEGELPPGKLWFAMEPLLGGSEKTAFAANDSAKGMLEALEAVGDGVDREDRQTVRGDPTTRYKAAIDPVKVVEALRERGDAKLAQAYETLAAKAPQPIGVEVWIDGKGLVRQISMAQQLPITDGNDLSVETRMQLYDFGPHPTIAPPGREQVFDFTPVLRAELGLDDGSGLGPLTPPAGAKPLGGHTFHRRAVAICLRVRDQAQGLLRRADPLIRAMKELGLDQEDEGRRLVTKFGESVAQPAARIDRRGTHELAALDPPASLAGAFHRYLLLDARQTEWDLAQARVLELGKTKLPSLAAREAEEPHEKSERKEVASQLGLSICEEGLRPAGPGQTAEASLE
ncbi:MAG TPA: hypothetical protein VMF55_01995 [Solirubrobacterales bacterium]|nr:hypothetical protein [Solirubrobacterales bacterium]